jgi:proteasome activator subunit 4
VASTSSPLALASFDISSGSKHWPLNKQKLLWKWFTPFITEILKQNIKTDTLVDYVVNEFNSLDFNGESSFDVVKALSLFRSFYAQMGWKFFAWTDNVVNRCWPEIHGEHDDVSNFNRKFQVV